LRPTPHPGLSDPKPVPCGNRSKSEVVRPAGWRRKAS
jgi:hypothetical protein